LESAHCDLFNFPPNSVKAGLLQWRLAGSLKRPHCEVLESDGQIFNLLLLPILCIVHCSLLPEKNEHLT